MSSVPILLASLSLGQRSFVWPHGSSVSPPSSSGPGLSLHLTAASTVCETMPPASPRNHLDPSSPPRSPAGDAGLGPPQHPTNLDRATSDALPKSGLGVVLKPEGNSELSLPAHVLPTPPAVTPSPRSRVDNSPPPSPHPQQDIIAVLASPPPFPTRRRAPRPSYLPIGETPFVRHKSFRTVQRYEDIELDVDAAFDQGLFSEAQYGSRPARPSDVQALLSPSSSGLSPAARRSRQPVPATRAGPQAGSAFSTPSPSFASSSHRPQPTEIERAIASSEVIEKTLLELIANLRLLASTPPAEVDDDVAGGSESPTERTLLEQHVSENIEDLVLRLPTLDPLRDATSAGWETRVADELTALWRRCRLVEDPTAIPLPSFGALALRRLPPRVATSPPSLLPLPPAPPPPPPLRPPLIQRKSTDDTTSSSTAILVRRDAILPSGDKSSQGSSEKARRMMQVMLLHGDAM